VLLADVVWFVAQLELTHESGEPGEAAWRGERSSRHGTAGLVYAGVALAGHPRVGWRCWRFVPVDVRKDFERRPARAASLFPQMARAVAPPSLQCSPGASGMLGSKSIMCGPAGPVVVFFRTLVKLTQARPSGFDGVRPPECLSTSNRQIP
jgi:hypothetical protein